MFGDVRASVSVLAVGVGVDLDGDGHEDIRGATGIGDSPSGNFSGSSGRELISGFGQSDSSDGSLSFLEFEGRAQLEDADVGGDPRRIVLLVHFNVSDLALLFESFVLFEVVLSGNDLDLAGGLTVTTVGSGDDGVLIVDTASAEVESTGGLEGDLEGNGVGLDLISSDDPFVGVFAELGVRLEPQWESGSPVELGL